MSRVNGHDVGRSRRIWLLVLGACTVWLVIQNLVLVLAVMWIEPAIARVVLALVKTSAVLIGRFWSTPAAVALLAGALTGLALRASRGPARRVEAQNA